MNRTKVTAALLLSSTLLSVWLMNTEGRSGEPHARASLGNQVEPRDPRQIQLGVGNAQVVSKLYEDWRRQHELRGGDHQVVVGLGWSKGLSRNYSEAEGRAVFDLFEGTVSVAVFDLPAEHDYDVWIVDNVAGPGRSVWPEEGDQILHLGRLEREAEIAKLDAAFGEAAFEDFEVNLVVVTEASMHPEQGGLLYGLPTFFQDRYTASRRAGIDLPVNPGVHAMVVPQTGPVPASAQPLSTLVDLGEKLFFREEFKGNGRTCGTCHPASNNFTLDQKFIACLPQSDPLFVAENNPELATLERPELMRKAALILENTNGFGDLANNFQMRGVQHTLGLTLSLMPAPFDGSTMPPNERTGWSGDGSPTGQVRDSGFIGAGTLKHFAVGAIVQHLPKTLNRLFHPPLGTEPDFRLPTDLELMALEAFQLSLGRQQELDVNGMVLSNPIAEKGRDLFLRNDKGMCTRCHEDAGANVDPGAGNANFDIGIEALIDTFGDLIDVANMPPDDGFGNPGMNKFNVQSLVEAADTGPFFHNNAINTLEAAVAFYNSDTFNRSQGGGFTNGINLKTTEVIAIAAFLRVINVQENIRQAIEFIDRAGMTTNPKRRTALFCRAADEVLDAAEVLEAGDLEPEMVKRLMKVHAWLDALCRGGPVVTSAAPLEDQARDELVAVTDDLVE